jgi:hypothetical protein
MYAIAASSDVNPPGEPVQISRAQMWRGLVSKAEYAVPFVPGMTECRVIEPLPEGFLREIVVRGVRMVERISLTPDVEVLFERVEPADGGWITNVLSDSERGLVLTFTFAVSFPGVEPESAEERAKGEAMRDSYIAAIASTIAETRRRVREGEL